MVTARFDAWRRALDAILDASPKQPRTFSRELKQALYDANPTCAICGQHIAEVDDEAVDHVEQYWLGGKTIPENARLTHRFCNWSRRRKEPTGAKGSGPQESPEGAEGEGGEGRPDQSGQLRRFWEMLLGRPKAQTSLHANLALEVRDRGWLFAESVSEGLYFGYVLRQKWARVELWIGGAENADENKEIFDRIHKHKEEIEKSFGDELSWLRLDGSHHCRITYIASVGGQKSDESDWPEIQDAMIDAMNRLEKALTPYLT
jgi:hypothetical protein